MNKEKHEKIKDIRTSMIVSNRSDMIRCIIEHAGDEFKDKESLIELAKETDEKICIRLRDMLLYFKNEL